MEEPSARLLHPRPDREGKATGTQDRYPPSARPPLGQAPCLAWWSSMGSSKPRASQGLVGAAPRETSPPQSKGSSRAIVGKGRDAQGIMKIRYLLVYGYVLRLL